jgi:Bax protein
MKSLCLTLFLFCQTTFNNFDFTYSTKEEFIKGIANCTLLANTFIPPTERVIILISVGQAVLESDWGQSRFAKTGNNFYGVIETDPTSPHLKALGNPKIMIRVYDKKCESVADYINILNTHPNFKEYQDLLVKQYISGEMDPLAVIKTLHKYAIDPNYVEKLAKTMSTLLKEYPTLFHLTYNT